MGREVGEGGAGGNLPDRVADRRVVDVPADLAFQPGVGGQAAGVAEKEPSKVVMAGTSLEPVCSATSWPSTAGFVSPFLSGE
jgi:hypothetical protein